MIRRLEKQDIDKVSEIWLDTNIKTHKFVEQNYWKDNFEDVKEMLQDAEIYVYEDDKKKIKGFIGLNKNYIEGIFVSEDAQSNGIGKQLLDFVKQFKTNLNLSVYKKNVRAIKFYQREGFEIKSEGIDENTGEKEYSMSFVNDILN